MGNHRWYQAPISRLVWDMLACGALVLVLGVPAWVTLLISGSARYAAAAEISALGAAAVLAALYGIYAELLEA